MPELETVVADINAVPEAVRPFYVEKDGKHVLSVKGEALPGFVPALTHAQFRETNTKLLQGLGVQSVEAGLARVALFAGLDPAKLEKLKAIDPDVHEALRLKVEAFEKKGVKAPDDLQAAIQAAVQAAVGPIKEDLSKSRERETAKDARLAKAAIHAAVSAKFTKAGGRADAGVLDFILSRAEDAFRVVDEKVVAADGRFGPEGAPLTVDEWITAATKEHAFAFDKSTGGGAPGGAGTSGAPKATPSTFKLPGGAEVKTGGIAIL